MSQASLFSALSASANLKANLGLNIKAPVLANLNLKGQANAQATSKVDVKATIKADKAQTADWKEGSHHKGGDTLNLDQLKHKFEGHWHHQGQNQGDSQAAYQHNTWQEPVSHQPAHPAAWQAHGEASIELTGQVQHHDTAWHA